MGKDQKTGKYRNPIAKTKDGFYSVSKPGSYSGVSKLSRYITAPKKVITRALLSEDAYTLHRPIVRKFPRRKVTSSGMGEQLQMDLLDVSAIKHHNKQYTFLLTCIDVFSKYAWVVPLKKKTSDELVRGITVILDRLSTKPVSIQTDRGSEFLNSKVQSLFKRNSITHFYTYNDEIKAGIVERFNRTLKMKLWRYFTASSHYKYLDVLENVVSSYNSTYHNTIGMSPEEVNTTNMESVWWRGQRVSNRSKTPSFEKGDHVRIAMRSKTFLKEGTASWSKELFQIHEVLKTNPITYRVRDLNSEVIEGSFYERELQQVLLPRRREFKIEKVIKTRGKGKRKQLLIKWMGYPESFNSWIYSSAVTKL